MEDFANQAESTSHHRLGCDENSKVGHIFGTNVIFFVTLALACLGILVKFYNSSWAGGKLPRKNDGEDCLGYDDLPKLKTWIPFKFIGNLPQFFPLRGLQYRSMKWAKDYGGVFTGVGLGQRFICITSAPELQALFKSSDFGHVSKASILYCRMGPFITNGVLVSQGTFWQQQRKLIMKSQTFLSLKSYIPIIESHTKRLVKDLETLFEDEKSHQIMVFISSTFLGIINEMITGKPLEGSDELTKYHHNFTIWKEVLFKRMLNPLFAFDFIWMFHPLCKRHDRAEKELFEFAYKKLSEHKQNRVASIEIENRILLDDLIDAGISDEQIVDEINTMMFGGHETGASAIHSFCFCMANHPEIQDRARQEVDSLFEDPGNFKDGFMTYETIQTNLKYVERCVLETLRLLPPVFAFARELQSPLEFEYKQKRVLIPPGINIIASPFITHRREEYFPEPLKFDPDRFLPEKIAKRHAYSFYPFAAGPRNCLGQKFAMIELKILAAYILRNFEMTTTDGMEDIPLLPYTTSTPERDYIFQFQKRAVKSLE